jgi:hypothetical protein
MDGSSGAVTELCTHCGVEVSAGVRAACPDCRLAPDVTVPPTLPASEDGPEEVSFDLSAWPAADRVALGVTLDSQEVPWRWEPGPALVVRAFDEAVVEEQLDEEGADDGGWEDVEGEESDEEAQTLMSDLFDVADRLVHTPWEADLLAEAARLGAAAGESKPPFGIEPQTWRAVTDRAGAIATAAEDEDQVAVEDAARELRDYLRDYV